MLTTILSTFALILLAEMGDKSQLVCMALASRHRPGAVLAGAAVAFTLLNVLAVVFGSLIAEWIPRLWLSAGVGLLFVIFGISALREGMESAEPTPSTGRSALFSAFLLIGLAEFGDKTQLTVAALGSTAKGLPVFVGATLALVFTSWLGVLGGRWLGNRIALHRLHQAGGVLFLLFAAWALYDAWSILRSG